MGDIDVPSPIDFHDLAEAKAWEEDTIARRPWRPEFFAAFASELKNNFTHPFSVLELGSGPGHLARIILSECSQANYCALDFSEAMHTLACERLGTLSGRVQFVTKDFRTSDWHAHFSPFDAVVTMQAAHELRHKRHLPKLLSQTTQLLTPGGMLLFCDHYAEGGQNPDLMLTRDDQLGALENAGFGEVRRILDEGGMALYAARRL